MQSNLAVTIQISSGAIECNQQRERKWENLQVVRSRLQEQGYHSEKRYSGMIDCIKKVFQTDGITGFYRGCATNLLRTTPAAVITFTSFEMIHRYLMSSFPSEPHPHAL
ncbi:hypothetical protein GIB67_024402, partial [Kingdonia uniflora]